MFLDTAGLMCWAVADDPHHADVTTLFDAAPVKLTHNYVLAELLILMDRRSVDRRHAVRIIDALQNHPQIEVVWVTKELHLAAWAFVQQQLDKRYSLCDAVSFVLMRQRKILEALTTDRHFEQAGFVRLLR
jgi:predicted nucleic acid-binding protein